MPRLISRSGKEKVVMLVSGQTHKLYRENLELAKSLGFRLECQEDFDRWFKGEQKKIRQELDRMTAVPRSDTQ